jgi:chromate transporter
LTQLQWVRVSGAFYRSGALVFGGGHVVLPLLQAQIVQPGWVAPGRFLGGYALAQALPGPLFTFAAYLGTVLHPGPSGVGGGLLALVAIFLPGLLILIGVLPFWRAISTQRWARAAMTGANAAVVGILAAALYNPVWITSVFSMADFVLVALAFVGLQRLRIAPVWVVMVLAGLGLAGF